MYVHFANGDVVRMSEKSYAKAIEESGTPHAMHRDGYQHQVIGVYADKLELPKKVEAQDDTPDQLMTPVKTEETDE